MADNQDKIINCPACGKPMKKVFMPNQGINIDVCVDGCGGIYFDNREFSKFDQPNEDISPILDVLKNRTFIKVNEAVIRVCPVCGTDMVKNYSNSRQDVQVDECYNCGGKFLDFGELEKIRNQYDTDRESTADIMRKLYDDIGVDSGSPMFVNKHKENNIKIQSFIVGIIVAGFWLYSQQSIISNHFSNTTADNSAFITVVIVAIAILVLFAGIGSLLGKSKSLYK